MIFLNGKYTVRIIYRLKSMDQQLLDLIEELRRLVPVLNSMSSTRGTEDTKSGDRGTDKIVNALARLTATLDTNNRTRAQQERAMGEFVKEVDKATDTQETLRKAQETAIKTAEEAAESQRNAARRATLSQTELAAEDKKAREANRRAENQSALSSLEVQNRQRTAAGQYVDEMMRGLTVNGMFNKKVEALAGESVALNVAFRTMAGAVTGAIDTLGAFGKATGKFLMELADGNTKFTSLNPIIDAVSDSLGKMAEAIPFAGSAISGALKIVAEGSKFVITQLQQTTETFNELGQAGALTARGMSGVQEQFLNSGMSLDGFRKSITENSATLARFRGTVGNGAEDFSKIVGDIVNSDVGDDLRRIGYNADQMGDAAGAFVSQQTRLGLSQNKTSLQLKQGTVEYAKELDLLAKVTGMNRKAIQDQQDAALGEGRFRAQIDEMIASGGEKAAKQLLDFQTQVSKISPELGAAVRDTATGFVNSSSAIKGFQASGGAIVDIVDSLKRGEISQGEALTRLQRATRENEDVQRTYAQAAGDGTDAFIKYAELSDFNRAQIEGNSIKAQKAQDAQVAGQDELTNKTVDAQKAMEQMGRQIQNFGFNAMPAATTAVQGFTTSLNEFIKVVARETGMELKGITAEEPVNPANEVQRPRTAADTTATLATLGLNPEKLLADQASRAAMVEEQDKANWEKAKLTEKASIATAQAIENLGDALGDIVGWVGAEGIGNRIKGLAGAAKEERVASDTQVLKDTGRLPTAPAPAAGGTAPGATPRPAAGGTAPATGGTAPATGGTAPAPGARAMPGTPVSAKPVAGVADAGKGFTTVNTVDGDKQRREGARNWRNNNPGNIEFGQFSQSMGAVGSDGRFAVFPTLAEGSKAKEELLFGSRSKYVNLSIADAINRYAPPTENNTAAYINSVVKALGVPPTTILGTLDSGQKSTLLSAINQVEGFKEGKVLQAATGGILSGPTSGYSAMLHGTEAVVPLPDGKSIPVQMDSALADTIKGLTTTMVQEIRAALQQISQPRTGDQTVLISTMQEMVREQRNNNSISQRMLQAAQN
jgi:hypothetical protein